MIGSLSHSLLEYSIYVGVVIFSYYVGRLSRTAQTNILCLSRFRNGTSLLMECDDLNDLKLHTRIVHSFNESTRSLPIFLDPPFRSKIEERREKPQSGGRSHHDATSTLRPAVIVGMASVDNDIATTYAEILVHPTMLVHPNPKKIAIYVSPDGLAKTSLIIDQIVQFHSSTVENISIFRDKTQFETTDEQIEFLFDHDSEINLEVVELLSDDDWNTTVRNEKQQQQRQLQREPFDVVILDRIEGESSLRPMFLSHHLDKENGILVTTLRAHHAHDRVRQIQNELVKHGEYEKVRDYEIGISSMLTSTPSLSSSTTFHFAVAFKNVRTYAHWHMNEAEYTLRMHQREIQVNHLQVFDGATMETLAFPSKSMTRAFCDLEFGEACDEQEWEYGLNPYNANIPFSGLEVKQSGVGMTAGRGVYTTLDAPQGTYFDLETTSQAVKASWTTTQLVFSTSPLNDVFRDMRHVLHHYFDGYGFYDEPFGQCSTIVDSGVLTFSNHGCNSTYNIGAAFSLNEFEIDLSQPPPDDFFTVRRPVYDPLAERDVFYEQTVSSAQIDIGAGEELFDNYLSFGGATYFKEEVQALRDQCSGIAGEVEEFQSKKRNKTTKNQGGKMRSDDMDV